MKRALRLALASTALTVCAKGTLRRASRPL